MSSCNLPNRTILTGSPIVRKIFRSLMNKSECMQQACFRGWSARQRHKAKQRQQVEEDMAASTSASFVESTLLLVNDVLASLGKTSLDFESIDKGIDQTLQAKQETPHFSLAWSNGSHDSDASKESSLNLDPEEMGLQKQEAALSPLEGKQGMEKKVDAQRTLSALRQHKTSCSLDSVSEPSTYRPQKACFDGNEEPRQPSPHDLLQRDSQSRYAWQRLDSQSQVPNQVLPQSAALLCWNAQTNFTCSRTILIANCCVQMHKLTGMTIVHDV